MNSEVSLEQVTSLATQLSPLDQLRLVQRIAADLVESDRISKSQARRHWSELRGAAAHPTFGEDAQEWVSRARHEADDLRKS